MRIPGPVPEPSPIYLRLFDLLRAGKLAQADVDAAAEEARTSENVLLLSGIRQLAAHAKLRVPADFEPDEQPAAEVVIWDPVTKRIVKWR